MAVLSRVIVSYGVDEEAGTETHQCKDEVEDECAESSRELDQ